MPRPEDFASKPLAVTVAALEAPEMDVSDRTQSTYCIGARIMLEHLMEGDLELSSENEAPFVREFLRRAVANAERQGITLD